MIDLSKIKAKEEGALEATLRKKTKIPLIRQVIFRNLLEFSTVK